MLLATRQEIAPLPDVLSTRLSDLLMPELVRVSRVGLSCQKVGRSEKLRAARKRSRDLRRSEAPTVPCTANPKETGRTLQHRHVQSETPRHATERNSVRVHLKPIAMPSKDNMAPKITWHHVNSANKPVRTAKALRL